MATILFQLPDVEKERFRETCYLEKSSMTEKLVMFIRNYTAVSKINRMLQEGLTPQAIIEKTGISDIRSIVTCRRSSTDEERKIIESM